MSIAAVLVERLESLGVALFSAPGGELRYRARKPVPDETRRLLDELRTVRDEAAAVLRERELPIPFPDEAELLRRRVARRERAIADLSGRYCPDCGFSAWRVTSRGDASCYGCELARRGIVPRCGRCGRREWRSEDGRRVCRYCEAAKAAGLFATAPEAARTGESPARSIPPEANRPGGAA